jgi:hypothetical protein
MKAAGQAPCRGYFEIDAARWSAIKLGWIFLRPIFLMTRTWLLIWALSAACFGACSGTSGPPKKVCYPVKGELSVKGQPAEGALIVLRPQGDANPDEWSAGFPRAHVKADGKFEVGTYGDNDGAPAGDYIVLVSWMTVNPQNEEASGTDRLRGRYADPSSSKLTVKVAAGPTELPPIRLP